MPVIDAQRGPRLSLDPRNNTQARRVSSPWIDAAPSDFARRARRGAVELLAETCRLTTENASELCETAQKKVAKLPIAERRWIHTLRAHRGIAATLRGLGQAGDRAHNAAQLAWNTGAGEVATAAGAKPDTPLHTAVTQQLLNPLED